MLLLHDDCSKWLQLWTSSKIFYLFDHFQALHITHWPSLPHNMVSIECETIKGGWTSQSQPSSATSSREIILHLLFFFSTQSDCFKALEQASYQNLLPPLMKPSLQLPQHNLAFSMPLQTQLCVNSAVLVSSLMLAVCTLSALSWFVHWKSAHIKSSLLSFSPFVAVKTPVFCLSTSFSCLRLEQSVLRAFNIIICWQATPSLLSSLWRL